MTARKKHIFLNGSMLDLLVTLGIVIAAIPIVVYFEVRPLISTVYFFVLLARTPKFIH